MKTIPRYEIHTRWRHTPDAADHPLTSLLAAQPDLTIPAGADDDEIGDQVGTAVRALMAAHPIFRDVVALVDGDEVTIADADEPEVCYGRASIIRPGRTAAAAAPATRRTAYELVTSAIADGLPIPMSIQMFDFHTLVLVLDEGDRAGVDRWLTRLGLSARELSEPDGESLRTYGTLMVRCAEMPDWFVQVYCPVPAAPDATESDR